MPFPEEPIRLGSQKSGEFKHGPDPGRQRSLLRKLIRSWLRAWRERRYVSKAGRELLALYRAQSIDHPGLNDREVYKLVVMERIGCDTVVADAILESAEESFTEWPIARELTLCDVVHYLAVQEFLQLECTERGMRSNVQTLVDSTIPANLCVIRKQQQPTQGIDDED